VIQVVRDKIAYASIKDGKFYFSIPEDNFNLMVTISHKARKLVAIKEYDKGYFVLDIDYGDLGVVEDYLDLAHSLHLLNISSGKVLNQVKEVRVH